MTSPNKRRFKMSALRADITKRRPSIEIEADDGIVFVIPPAELWPDGTSEKASAGDATGASRDLLGDQYDAWVAAGGTFGLIGEVIGQVSGASLGESGASSTS